ncbi:MAG: beta-ketoacyl-ACP synthase II [Actinomycetota bacterium]
MTEVVVTGVGLVTPLGIGTQETWEGLIDGRSGAGPLTRFDASGYPVQIACEVKDFDASKFMGAREASRCDRFTHLSVAAAKIAWRDGGMSEDSDHERIGVIAGTGIGGLSTIEHEHQALLDGGPRRVSPFMVPKLMPNGAAATIAMELGLRGPSFATSSACASGAHAVGDAFRYIQCGAADAMLAGATEAALTPLALAAFARMGALSTRNDDPQGASRPFDADRDGFVFGEGAGILMLESLEHAQGRGARILARISGYHATCDAHHVTQPDPEGRGATLAMIGALQDAGVEPADVDYINAHGTSTPFNDKIETVAIKNALGNEAKAIPISSTKSQLGHLLGAAGAVEAGLCALAIERGVVPGTINLQTPDPDCDLDYLPDGPREEDVRVAVSNSFGFGGQNACLVLTAHD